MTSYLKPLKFHILSKPRRMSSAKVNLNLHYHYILLRVTPDSDALKLRKGLQESLGQTFGLTVSGMHVDVLWMEDDHAAIRVGSQ